MSKNASRGSYEAKRDKNSALNYIVVKDTKIVSFLSTAAGVEPRQFEQRHIGKKPQRENVLYPNAFDLYNKCMGGVDLYDQHCSDLYIRNRRRKWTWALFLRLIESAISNATVLWNLCIEEENQKIGTYDMAKSLAKYYLKKGAKTKYKKHKIIQTPLHRLCNVCKRETYMLCVNCNEFFCLKQTCFGDEHSVTIHTSRSHESKLECSIRNCNNRTKKFCEQCNMHICTECFDGGEHTIIQ